jgi:hypothetical protein
MVAVDKGATRVVAAVLALIIVGVAAISIRGFRRSKRPRLHAIIGAYDIALLAAWTGALLIDDGYGAAYFPGIIMTAPWSFLAIFLAVKGPAGILFTSGWLGNFIENFVLFVVVCGGMNNLVLYFVIRKWFYPVEGSGRYSEGA